MGLAQIQKDLLDGTTTMVELVSEYLKRIGDCQHLNICLLYTSPSPRDRTRSRMPSSA